MNKNVIASVVLIGLLCVFSSSVFAQEYDNAADFLFERAQVHYQEGNYQSALAELEKVLMMNPWHAQALTYIELIERETDLEEEPAILSEDDNFPKRLRESAISWALQDVEVADEEFPPVAELLAEGSEPGFTPYRGEVQQQPEEEHYQSDEPENAPVEVSRALDILERAFSSLDRVDEFVDDLNEDIDPVKVSGEYLLSVGVRDNDFTWKDANGDHNETNWRRIHKDFGVNTYDTRVYNKVRVNIDKEEEQGLGFHSNITIDPWTFIGKTEAVNISSPNGERANVQFKYWSGNNSTINETYLTLSKGASIAPPETKVVDGKVAAMTVDNTWSETLSIPELEIDEEMWPVRELWLDYKSNDKIHFRFFPVAYEDQALTSDDPLQLSGHRIFWEESPWMDRWRPGILNAGTSPVDFTQGEWEDDLSFFTRDSNMTRLTSLRGFSMKSKPLENLSIDTTVASPKGLWQDYDSFDNVEGASRIKLQATENLQLGLVNTTRFGLIEGAKDAENFVHAVDVSYQLLPDLSIEAEVAYSRSKQDLTQEPYNTESLGNAYRFQLQKGKTYEQRPEKWDEEAYSKAEPFDYSLRLMYTHMDDGFFPALANYRITRKDPFWGRHIHFEQPYEKYYGGLYYPTVTWYDIRADRIGDSVDIDRDVVSLRAEKAFFDNSLETLLDVRNAHEASSGKYIETIGRTEADWQATDKLLVKFLGIYHDLPSTTGGVDPLIYDVDTDKFFNNAFIEDDKDPSLKTVSTGFQYDFFNWLSFDCVYEYTNDFTVALDDYPRGLLNDNSFSTRTEDGLVWRESAPFLHTQQFFPRPPYPWFNIYKAGLDIRPVDDLSLRFEFTKNDFKYAGQVDDNINHLGFEANYDFNDKISLRLNYAFSRSYDVFQQQQGTLDYGNHHNIFVNFDYKMDDNGVFTLQFGEAALLPYSTMFTTSPYPGFMPTLDTAHVVRAYLSRRF